MAEWAECTKAVYSLPAGRLFVYRFSLCTQDPLRLSEGLEFSGDVMAEDSKITREHPKKLVSKSYLLELEEKSKLADEYLDQLQRLQAEYENYRKRVIKEKGEYRKYVLEGFLYELLSVVDNIQRAVGVSSENHKFSSLLDGVNIVEKQFLELLKAHGAVPLKTNIGEKFDPHLHHAMSNEPSKEYPVDTIIKVFQQGYQIGNRILRPAMVVVSSGEKPGEDK